MLIVLEGLDRTGKSTMAARYAKAGFEIVHFSAPPKGATPEGYFAETLRLVASTYGKNIVWDRSHYGELVWPQVFDRPALLSESAISQIDGIIRTVHRGQFEKIYMFDPDRAAHLARMLANKEPKYDISKAIEIYEDVAKRFHFDFKILDKADENG